MSRIEKNIIATLIGLSIIAFGILYRKTNTTASNIVISLGIVILLISYFIINNVSQDLKPKKISYIKNGIQKGKYYKYIHEPNTIIHLSEDQPFSTGKQFIDQNGDVLVIEKSQFKTSIA